MTTAFAPFDAAGYLDGDEVIAEYLSAAAEDPNLDVFLAALGDVAKARGMAQIARDAGLGRESLPQALSEGGRARFETISAILRALGRSSRLSRKKRPLRRSRNRGLRPDCWLHAFGGVAPAAGSETARKSRRPREPAMT